MMEDSAPEIAKRDEIFIILGSILDGVVLLVTLHVLKTILS